MKPITIDVKYWAPRALERITVTQPEDAITNLKELLLHPDVSGVQMTVEKSDQSERGY